MSGRPLNDNMRFYPASEGQLYQLSSHYLTSLTTFSILLAFVGFARNVV
jgi:hypothetical protein